MPETTPAPAGEGWSFTPLEEFLWLNDGPEHPMVFRLVLNFSGTCSRAAVEQGFQLAVARHPLFSCQAVKDDSGWKMVPAANPPKLEWRDDPPEEIQRQLTTLEYFDLLTRPGLRTTLWHTEDGLLVLQDVHHVCADAQALRQFLTDWFAAYSRLSGDDIKSLPDLIPERLAQRDVYPVVGPQVGFWEGIRNLIHTLSGKTARLRAHGQPDAPTSHLIMQTFSIEETARCREKLKEQSLSVNDLGLTLSLTSFADEFPDASRGRVITVINPVDLRRPSDLRLPACNRLGFIFIRRRIEPATTTRSLSVSVHEEMMYIKSKRVGEEFPKALALARKFPRGIRGLIQSGWFTPSLLFTCLGDTTSLIRHRRKLENGVVQLTGLHLETVAGYAPLGVGVPLSVSVCETNNRLSITVRASGRYLTAEQSRHYTETLRRHWLRWIDSEPASAISPSTSGGHS